MSRSKRIPRGKLIKPTFFVFCEGQSEEQYVSYLRSKYRIPMVIDSKITGNKISESYIENYKRAKFTHEKDKEFLMYDLDVEGMLERLKGIGGAILVTSNPCFEFWLLLHFQSHTTEITSAHCINKLEQHYSKYKKGNLDSSLIRKLEEKQLKACNRAKRLSEFNNPSSKIHELIGIIENSLGQE